MLFIKKDFINTTRFKTTLWYAGLFLLLEIVSELIIISYLTTGLFKDLDNSLSKQAQTIYKSVLEYYFKVKDFKPDSIYSSQEDLVFDLIFEAIVINPRSTFIQVKLHNNLIFQSENLENHLIDLGEAKNEQLSMVSFEDTFLSDYELRAAHLSRDNYDIIVAFPTILINKTLRKLTELNLIIGPVFLLLAILGGAIISAKSLSRIDSIIKKTEVITAQNLSEKIQGENYDDEYGRLVKTMNEMISRIKTSIDYMNNFSAFVSHELKTPLTILRGELEIALKSPRTAEEYKKILQSNHEEALHLINIVDKLFFASKIDHFTIKLNKEKIEISKLIRPILNHTQMLAKNKNMEIVITIKEHLILLIDVDLIRRAISNLVENAIKYGYAGSTVSISAGLEKTNCAYVSVNNKGRIIPSELHTKIFERFFRSDTSRDNAPSGIGLGLAISKTIVEYHGGKIGVESNSENGTTFCISLNLGETLS